MDIAVRARRDLRNAAFSSVATIATIAAAFPAGLRVHVAFAGLQEQRPCCRQPLWLRRPCRRWHAILLCRGRDRGVPLCYLLQLGRRLRLEGLPHPPRPTPFARHGTARHATTGSSAELSEPVAAQRGAAELNLRFARGSLGHRRRPCHSLHERLLSRLMAISGNRRHRMAFRGRLRVHLQSRRLLRFAAVSV